MVALAQRAAAEADAVPEAGLSVEERITRDMLGIVGGLITEENENHYYEIGSVDQINGPQTMLAQLSQFQPADTPERLDAWIARLRAYGPYIDANIAILGTAGAPAGPRPGS